MKTIFTIIKLFLIIVGFIGVISFLCERFIPASSQVDTKEKLDMREFFNGEVEVWGSFFDWCGRKTRGFTISMLCEWQGNDGTMKELIKFDDGEVLERVWYIKLGEDGKFTAAASDVEPNSGFGRQLGNAIHTKYILKVPYKGRILDVDMDGRMYKVDENSWIDRVIMRKFGFRIGHLSAFMQKKVKK